MHLLTQIYFSEIKIRQTKNKIYLLALKKIIIGKNGNIEVMEIKNMKRNIHIYIYKNILPGYLDI